MDGWMNEWMEDRCKIERDYRKDRVGSGSGDGGAGRGGGLWCTDAPTSPSVPVLEACCDGWPPSDADEVSLLRAAPPTGQVMISTWKYI